MRIKELILFTFILSTTFVSAQPYKTRKISKPYKWMFGIHWSVVEDDGEPFKYVMNAGTSWNLRPYPTKLTVDRYLKNGWSLELSLLFAQYMPSNLVNGQVGVAGFMGAGDFHAKWSFYERYAPKARWIEPYITFGGGYTFRAAPGAISSPTANIGGGLNFWMIESLGIQLATNAKFAFIPTFWKTPGNYLNHSIGIVYRTPSEKKERHQNDKKRYPWTKDKKHYNSKNRKMR